MPSAPKPMPAGALEALCRELGETATGSQLTRLMAEARLTDVSGESTKWKRLHYSIMGHQKHHRDGRALNAVLHAFMDPARWVARPEAFKSHRTALNISLALAGLELRPDGRVARLTERARTLDEAQDRADALGAELRRRGVHPDVLAFCQAQLLQENYFHAVLEACKSVAERIRVRSGLTGDGNDLFDRAFTLRHNMPPFAFNRLRDACEQSEHVGLATLIRGIYGVYRNTTAHAPAVRWATERSEAVGFADARLDASS